LVRQPNVASAHRDRFTAAAGELSEQETRTAPAQSPVAGSQTLVPCGAGVVADLSGGVGFGGGTDSAQVGVGPAEAGKP